MLYLVQRCQAFWWFVRIPHLWTLGMKCFHKSLLLSNSQWLITQLPLVSTLLKFALWSSTTLRMHWHHIWPSHGFYADHKTPAPFNGKHLTGRSNTFILHYPLHNCAPSIQLVRPKVFIFKWVNIIWRLLHLSKLIDAISLKIVSLLALMLS